MLYKKNGTTKLDKALFANPTSEYRGAPFWSWNCHLEQEELDRQIEILHQMGFGGFHIHVRTGLDTPYLGDEFMQLVKHSVDEAKEKGMLAYLYDEDRWPSGTAGGFVTQDKQYRARYLLFTPTPYGQGKMKRHEISNSQGARTENGRLIACYDIELDDDGYLRSARIIDETETAKHDKWYAYLETPNESAWYNNQTYVNTLDKKALDRFIDITYKRYQQVLASEFDQAVPSIFTDEPQFTWMETFGFAHEKKDVTIPWTDDLPETFRSAYGEDLIAGLPELMWELPDGQVSVIRYHYHDHVCERFVQAFADNCGQWCCEHGLMLTGHLAEEPTLKTQTRGLGEVMRPYRGFGQPGIDMLCAKFEYTTAKQAQSAVHQFGREGMTSELYGVTNWDFDFRGHKLHGDWQAALGVTLRVLHLSWVSMAGEAKRDYPASISYQSPWWQEYRNVEDHFARVNTAMTRGKPLVRVGVIHPVESYWLHWGPSEQTELIRNQMDEQFENVTKWLLFGAIDFDFISESLLPEQCSQGANPLQVGQMAYDVVLVAGCETLRTSTLERLEAFKAAGGKLIFMGDAPKYENAVPSTRGQALYAQSVCIPANRGSLLDALESARQIELRNADGSMTDNLLYQLRQDGDSRWLFLAHGTEPYNKDIIRYQDLRIRIKGKWRPTLYDTQTGTQQPLPCVIRAGITEISRRMYDYDSLLVLLEPAQANDFCTVQETLDVFTGKPVCIPKLVDYKLSEPNTLLLDNAEYRLDDEPWQPAEEILRLDNLCRKQLNWPPRTESFAQPWVVQQEPMTHKVTLRYTIPSDIELETVSLAIEDAENLSICWNDEQVPIQITGWYADKAIKTVPLGKLHKGENVLIVEIPFGRRSNVEWAYLLGEFGVKVAGRIAWITDKPDKIGFGSFTHQGLPFFGGNLTYCFDLETEAGSYAMRLCRYRGTMLRVSVDGEDKGTVIYPPYVVQLGSLSKGKHHIEITLMGHRRNSFGPVHLADLKENWIGPDAWRSVGDRWCYDYIICEEGLLSSPEIIRKEQP